MFKSVLVLLCTNKRKKLACDYVKTAGLKSKRNHNMQVLLEETLRTCVTVHMTERSSLGRAEAAIMEAVFILSKIKVQRLGGR